MPHPFQWMELFANGEGVCVETLALVWFIEFSLESNALGNQNSKDVGNGEASAGAMSTNGDQNGDLPSMQMSPPPTRQAV